MRRSKRMCFDPVWISGDPGALQDACKVSSYFSWTSENETVPISMV